MPTDYQKITNENIRKYGTDIDTYGPVLLANLYSDRTHFLYELLQNAEDAGATWTVFSLSPDRLEFTHDGKPFDEADVRGICGIVAGTKSQDLDKIGKFGIGFKSVYSYTNSPRVYSLGEAFEICNYVRPHAIKAVPLRSNETLFVFPFDHHEVSAATAYKEIGSRLRDLGSRTLLFLKHIQNISWKVNNQDTGTYLRLVNVDEVRYRRVYTASEVNGVERDPEEWLIFTRPVQTQGTDNVSLKVEVAYKTASKQVEGKDIDSVASAEHSHLVVYFPTKIETHLKFLIQGPYKTTPTRESISMDHPLNASLLGETAALVAETLPQVKEMGLLTVDFLNVMPIRKEDFPEHHLFRPVYDAVLAAIKSDEEFLPAEGGGHVSFRKAFFGRGRELIQLLDGQRLSSLFKVPGARWLDSRITQDKTPDLRKYLVSSYGCDIQEVGPDTFASRFSEEFIRAQDDAWIVRFYAFMRDQPALWRQSTQWASAGTLRTKPIIRIEDGSHVPPFDRDGKPCAYLPGQASSSFPTVRKSIAQDPQSRDFLTKLGLTEPDKVSEIIEYILPRYSSADARVSQEENLDHVKAIIAALGTDSEAKRKDLIDRLKLTPFLLANRNTTTSTSYKKPADIYLSRVYSDDGTLATYFAGNHESFFLSDRYSELRNSVKITDFLNALGIERRPRRRVMRPDLTNQEMKRLRQNSPCTEAMSDESKDYDLDGLDYLLRNITPDKAKALWGFLIDYLGIYRSSSFLKGEYWWFYKKKHHVEIEASFVKKLKRHSWLPDENGALHRPSELPSTSLPEDFDTGSPEAKTLVEHLGLMKSLEQEYLAQLSDEDRKKFQLAKKVSLKRLQDLVAEEEEPTPTLPETKFSFTSELRRAFGRPGSNRRREDEPPTGAIPDPARRGNKVREEIEEAKRGEPAVFQRFKRVPSKIWEQKNSETRLFLKQEYGGRCQICDYTFLKRNGEPYFEGVYLVSRTNAAWIDRPGNVLCLCANCCAKFEHGSVEAEDVDATVSSIDIRKCRQGEMFPLSIVLCDEEAELRFTQRHLLDLQQMIASCEEDLRSD